jgi:hypothetical protein
VEPDWPDRDSREWLLGPRGAELEPWQDAAEHLPGADSSIGALLCVPNTPPTIWLRDEAIDDAAVWDLLKSLVMTYDAGDRDDQTWTPVLDGHGHLTVLAGA